MFQPVRRLVLALLVPLFFVPSALCAQEPATSLSELPRWVRIGDRVTVTDASGHKLTGRVGDLKPDGFSLVGDRGDRVSEFGPADVQAITRRDPDSLRNGALIGLGVGAGLVLLAAVGSGDPCGYEERNCAGWILLAAAAYGGLGAGIGAGIDALTPGPRRVIYRRPAGHATIGIAPHLTPQRQAVVLSVGF